MLAYNHYSLTIPNKNKIYTINLLFLCFIYQTSQSVMCKYNSKVKLPCVILDDKFLATDTCSPTFVQPMTEHSTGLTIVPTHHLYSFTPESVSINPCHLADIKSDEFWYSKSDLPENHSKYKKFSDK